MRRRKPLRRTVSRRRASSKPAATTVLSATRRRSAGVRARREKDRNAVIIVAAFVAAVLFVWFIIARVTGYQIIKIDKDNVAAFRIPYESITGIYELSEKYGISFTKLLTIYSLDNRFFDKGEQAITDIGLIEKTYILNYESIDEKYPQKYYSEYYKIISSIFSEIKAFPIEYGTTTEDYMFGNSYGAEITYGENGFHYGADIHDRENVRGRLNIVSMTDGYVSGTGWDKNYGYFISITTNNGTIYYYAHFSSLSPGLKQGDIVSANQILGQMGDTGLSKTVGTTKNFPVHLHIGIAPATKLSKKTFWINPYCILKYAEWRYAYAYLETEE